MPVSVYVKDAAEIADFHYVPPFKALVNRVLKRWLPARWFWRFRAWRMGRFDSELALLPTLCHRNKASVDVGASTGSYTAHLLAHSGSCWAFEPRPRAAAIMVESLTDGHDPRLHVETVALSDHDGDALLRVALDDLGRSTLEPANAIEDVAEYAELSVPGRCLDDYIDALGPVGFIKVDVEGHEAAVLRGATAVLERDHPVLLLELEERHKRGAIADVARLLAGFGYRGFYFRGGTLRPLSTFRPAMQDVSLIGRMIDGENAYVNNFIFLEAGALVRAGHLLEPRDDEEFTRG
jgi:FkbM family methyltransferase